MNTPACDALPSLVSLVIPLFNEAPCLPALEAELARFVARHHDRYRIEIVLVDDGSTDGTWELIKAFFARCPGLRALRLSRNFGHQHAIFAGYRETLGDAVVSLDGDLQDPLDVIDRMLDHWRAGADVVIAVRTTRAGETWFKQASAKLFYRLVSWLSKLDAPLDAGDFRLLSRRALDGLLQMPERHRYLRGMVAWIGFDRAIVEYTRPARVAGVTKFSIARMIRFGADAIVSFSSFPLRLAFVLSALAAIPFLLYAACNLLLHLLGWKQMAPGWTSLLLAIVTFGTLILISIGLLGEYVGRIFDSVKQRPDVIVKERC